MARRNGVIITVYVESPTIRARSHRPIKKSKPNPSFKTPKTSTSQGYDRRAQLLAYARELRGAENGHKWPGIKRSRPQHKKWMENLGDSVLETLHQWITKRPWRYERMDDCEEDDRCLCRSSSRKNKKPGRRSRSNSKFWLRKLKRMLKGLSCGWHCNKNTRVDG